LTFEFVEDAIVVVKVRQVGLQVVVNGDDQHRLVGHMQIPKLVISRQSIRVKTTNSDDNCRATARIHLQRQIIPTAHVSLARQKPYIRD